MAGDEEAFAELVLRNDRGELSPAQVRGVADAILAWQDDALASWNFAWGDFVETALYHPRFGYYTRAQSPVGREGDFITAPALSPAFAFAIGKLCREFLRCNTDGVSTIVDVGSGSGELVRELGRELGRTLCAPTEADTEADTDADTGRGARRAPFETAQE